YTVAFYSCCFFVFFFFFQAEDGIRDDLVTGVQTCALPISARPLTGDAASGLTSPVAQKRDPRPAFGLPPTAEPPSGAESWTVTEIGRASCRERVESAGVAGTVRKRRKEGKRGEEG